MQQLSWMTMDMVHIYPMSETDTEIGDITWSGDTRELSVDFGDGSIVDYTFSLENNNLILYKAGSKMVFVFSKAN